MPMPIPTMSRSGFFPSGEFSNLSPRAVFSNTKVPCRISASASFDADATVSLRSARSSTEAD